MRLALYKALSKCLDPNKWLRLFYHYNYSQMLKHVYMLCYTIFGSRISREMRWGLFRAFLSQCLEHSTEAPWWIIYKMRGYDDLLDPSSSHSQSFYEIYHHGEYFPKCAKTLKLELIRNFSKSGWILYDHVEITFFILVRKYHEKNDIYKIKNP